MSKFQYQARDAASVKRRAEQASKEFAVMVDRRFRVFTPKEGDYDVRFLPPTWNDADHYGMNVFVHYGIGADDEAYLCLKEMGMGACPICEEVARAKRSNEDEKYVKDLTAKKRVAAWVIDRANEEAGPLMWFMPWTLDKDIAKVSYDHKTEEILAVDHPEDGYDVQFSREGSGLKTRYSGAQVDRRSSPLSRDDAEIEDWLDFIVENPVPSALNYYSYEHIKRVFSGVVSDGQGEAPPEKLQEARKENETPPQEDPPEGEVSLPSEEDIMQMSEDDLWALIEEHNVDLDLDKIRSLRAKRKALVGELLGSEGEAEEEGAKEESSTASRLRQRLADRQRASA